MQRTVVFFYFICIISHNQYRQSPLPSVWKSYFCCHERRLYKMHAHFGKQMSNIISQFTVLCADTLFLIWPSQSVFLCLPTTEAKGIQIWSIFGTWLSGGGTNLISNFSTYCIICCHWDCPALWGFWLLPVMWNENFVQLKNGNWIHWIDCNALIIMNSRNRCS